MPSVGAKEDLLMADASNGHDAEVANGEKHSHAAPEDAYYDIDNNRIQMVSE